MEFAKAIDVTRKGIHASSMKAIGIGKSQNMVRSISMAFSNFDGAYFEAEKSWVKSIVNKTMARISNEKFRLGAWEKRTD